MSTLRESAKGQDCAIRVPGYCNFNRDTTVLCHGNGAGVAIKKDDMQGAFGCSACHGVVDGAIKTDFTPEQRELMHRQGIERTQQWWRDNGYIKICKPETEKISGFGLADDFFN